MNRMHSQVTNRTLLLICVLLLMAGIVVAQDTTPSTAGQSPSGQTTAAAEPTSEASDVAAEPSLSIFGDTMTGRLTLSGSANVAYQYDDNVISNDAVSISDHIANISSRFSAAVQKKKLSFQMHYAPSLRVYGRHLDDRSAFSQQFANSIDYRFGARTMLRWAGSVADTSTTAASPFSFTNVGGEIFPIFHPDALQTNARVLHSNGSLGLEHNFTARSGMHVTVHGSTTNFFERNGVPLATGRAREQYSSGANTGWNYEFVQGKKIGFEAGYSYFGFLSPASHSSYEFTKFRYEQSIGKGFSFRLGAGPSWQQSQFAAQNNKLGYALDFSVAKQAVNYNMLVAYSKGSDLGSAQGTLTSDRVTLALGRSFLRRWNASGSVAYSSSAQAQATEHELQNIATTAELGYALSPMLRAYTQYSYVNQFGRTGPLSIYNYDRNLFSVGVGYTFGAAGRRR